MSSSKPIFQNSWDWLMLSMCGLCMGAADLVPGISGGTIAFMLGFYQDLLRSIKSFDLKALALLFKFRIREFLQVVAWEFLLALGSGIILAFILFSKGIDYVLNHETYRVLLYSSFLGLITASTFFFVRQIKRWSLSTVAALILGIVTAYLLTGSFRSNSQERLDLYFPADQLKFVDFSKKIQNYDLAEQKLLDIPLSTLSAMLSRNLITESTPVYNRKQQTHGIVSDYIEKPHSSVLDGRLVLCGIMLICAMLLPGISGSYLLVVLGIYAMVIGALTDFIEGIKHGSWNQDAFAILSSLSVGMVIGGLSFARLACWLLKRYPDISIALLTGFMAGALRSMWPFWSYVYAIDPLKPSRGLTFILQDPILPNIFTPLFFVAAFFASFAFVFIYLLESWAAKREGPFNHSPLSQ